MRNEDWPKKTQVLIDLETLGTKPGDMILSIGALEFDWEASMMLTRFYCVINPIKSGNAGFRIDPATLMWWTDQESDLWGETYTQVGAVAPREACELLAGFFQECRLEGTEVETVWGNSPSFDCALLRAYFERSDLPVPWEYWQERDVRSALDGYARRGVDVKAAKIAAEARPGLHGLKKHHALHDATREVAYLLECETWAKTLDEERTRR